MSRSNATRDQIAELLRAGASNASIARQLRCDRVRIAALRRELGIPAVAMQPLTLEETWRAHTQDVGGGHLAWTGTRGTVSGTPVHQYKGKAYTAAAIAFRLRHGREPVGRTFSDCGLKQCVALDHVDDEVTRKQTREQLRYLAGGRERRALCCRGHDQAVHGLYERDGRAYCGECKRQQKKADA